MSTLLDFDSIENYRVVVIACSVFMMWLINLVMLHLCGMSQAIYETKTIDKMDRILQGKHKDSVPLHRMMTRCIDYDGKYRRKVMTNIVMIYGITNFCMFLILIYIIVTNPSWIYDHFILVKEESVPYKPYQLFTCIGFSYFLFEMVYNHQYDYYDWNKTVSSHHWVGVFGALFAMNGYCLPFCTFYGINATILSWPQCFFMSWIFSANSYKYPNKTRAFSVYIHSYHSLISLFNVTGTVYICANSIKIKAIQPYIVGLFACVALIWIYDDLNTIQWLNMLSVHQYQDIQFYKKQTKKTK